MAAARKAPARKAPARKTAARSTAAAKTPDTVPAALRFTTTGKSVTPLVGKDSIVFELDGERMVAVKPKDTLLLLLEEAIDDPEKAKSLVGVFIDSCLDEASTARVKQRLAKRRTDDKLDLADMAEVLAGLLAQWKPGNRASRRAAARA